MLCFLVFSFFLMGQSRSAEFKTPNFQEFDIFDVVNIDPYEVRKNLKNQHESEIDKLDDLLVGGTDSTDPKVNLDFLLEEFISDMKKKVPYNEPSAKAKRLLLALNTLKDQNECSQNGDAILLKNWSAIQPSSQAVMNDVEARRIDKLFAYYMKRRIKNCREIYIRKFDQIYNNMDKELIKRIDTFLNDAVKDVTSDGKNKNSDKNHIQRLLSTATTRYKERYQISLSYMHNKMVESARGPSYEKYFKLVENKRRILKREILGRIFIDTIAKPCASFRKQLGPDVFEPLLFDCFYEHELFEDRTDFYDALLKYQMCYFGGFSEKNMLDRIVAYANTLHKP